MHRTITLDDTPYTANIGILDDYRVTVKDDEISVSSDLAAITPGADFEAVFHGTERIEIIAAPEPETQTEPERYTIGPLEPDAGETPLVLAKRAKLSEIANARWKAETVGVTVGEMNIDTSRESRPMITEAALQATLNNDYTANWKTAAGFVTLTAETILAVAAAVRQHVESCFDREAQLTTAVNAATTVEAVETLSWDAMDS
jgi:hypothetical protein